MNLDSHSIQDIDGIHASWKCVTHAWIAAHHHMCKQFLWTSVNKKLANQIENSHAEVNGFKGFPDGTLFSH